MALTVAKHDEGASFLNRFTDLVHFGRISLERGIGQKPRALHVTLRKGNRLVGTSKFPQPPNAEDTTLEARIKYARDSLYDEELYHEMVRESRALPSLGVPRIPH